MAQKYGPVGECIYCRAKQYAPDSNRPLAVEHIVPYGLSGDLELLESSCRACERITGSIESSVLRGHLLGSRTAMGLKSRSGPLRDPLPLFVGSDHRTRIKVSPKDCPSILLLPLLADPAIIWEMSGWGQPPHDELPPFVHWFNYQPKLLREKYGVDRFTTPYLDAPKFCRMIAKVAHSWAVATLGMSAFHPVLADLIRDENKDSRAILSFVGGVQPAPPDKVLHTLRAYWHDVEGRKLLLADIRLFANLGAPTYRVVVGTEPSALLAPLPKCAVPTSSLHKAYRVTVRVE